LIDTAQLTNTTIAEFPFDCIYFVDQSQAYGVTGNETAAATRARRASKRGEEGTITYLLVLKYWLLVSQSFCSNLNSITMSMLTSKSNNSSAQRADNHIAVGGVNTVTT
jgi:hypothetical protein